MTTPDTQTRVCRHCGDYITPFPGGWAGPDDWESCKDTGEFHEPADSFIKICRHCYSDIHLSDPGCVWVDVELRENCEGRSQRHQPTIVGAETD